MGAGGFRTVEAIFQPSAVLTDTQDVPALLWISTGRFPPAFPFLGRSPLMEGATHQLLALHSLTLIV